MNFGIHPVILIAMIGIVLAGAAIAVACFIRNIGVKIVLVLASLVCLAPGALVFVTFHPEWVDARFRAYKTFYKDIQTGMTRDEVFTVLNRDYPKSGPRQPPKIMNDTTNQLGFFMDPETSREPNCEGIFLTLDHGRVIKKEYSAD